MNFLFNLRISQKIMALVAGLCFGFIAIGIAYFIQINQLSKQSNARAELDILRGDLVVLATQAGFYDGSEQAHSKLNDLVGGLEQYSALKSSSDLKIAKATLAELNNLAQTRGDLALEVATLNSQILESTNQFVVEFPSQVGLVSQLIQYETLYRTNPQPELLSEITAILSNLLQLNTASEKAQLITQHAANFEELAVALHEQNKANVKLQELDLVLASAISGIAQLVSQTAKVADDLAKQQAQILVAVFIVMVSVIVTATAVGVYFIYKSIVFPMTHIQSVIRRINKGNLKARVKLIERDELGDLGIAFNQLLDERIQTLEEQSLENERLNNSIISLIRAVGVIARKDLTVKVPVSADITGTISDAVNLLTSETAKTLARVKDISSEVDRVADVLQSQSTVVLRVAEDERRQVLATVKALDTSARAMNDIAEKAGLADNMAKAAMTNTQQARESVEQSVQGILNIRETISETEKRIKRLGDRSQEVSGIVNLINTIAERTHILALNASMHAASAGDAGKGFAVVADEVQRLAENAREATADISSMVNNIRVETADTVNIMNKLIAEVAEGTKTAEIAGRRMNDTDIATNELVNLVAVMAERAVAQAEVTTRVRDRAMIIRNFSEKTGSQLIQQKGYTDSLKQQSESLVEQVNLFKLPEPKVIKAPTLITKVS